jgi:hypothetical protein
MRPVNDTNYIYLLCALFYIITVAVAVASVGNFLMEPMLRRRSLFAETTFRSGDLILWSKCLKWYTDIEKIVCGSRYTHVTLVVVSSRGVPYGWETNVETGHQLKPLALLVAEKSDCVCVLRKLNRPVDESLLCAFVRDNIGNKYSYNVWDGVVNQLLSSIHKRKPAEARKPTRPRERLDIRERWDIRERSASCTSRPLFPRKKRFCSQLVADTYMHLGVIDLFKSVKSKSKLVLPGDFSAANDHNALHWVQPYALGPEIKIIV